MGIIMEIMNVNGSTIVNCIVVTNQNMIGKVFIFKSVVLQYRVIMLYCILEHKD